MVPYPKNPCMEYDLSTPSSGGFWKPRNPSPLRGQNHRKPFERPGISMPYIHCLGMFRESLPSTRLTVVFPQPGWTSVEGGQGWASVDVRTNIQKRLNDLS